jgi:hypothetical protein
MSDDKLEKAVEEYRQLYIRLKNNHPEEIYIAEGLAKNIVDPRTASADEIWEVLWSKPLFANARSAVVENNLPMYRDLLSGKWDAMVKADGDYAIIKTGGGRKDFDLIGGKAQNIVDNGIARHRLFAIVGAARALAKRSELISTPYADVFDTPLDNLLTKLREEFGYGWGPATTLHFLTDLGLACKPDIHLVRTMRYLGYGIDPKRDTATLKECVWLNDIVKKLVPKIKGSFTPAHFREVDYILMRISLRGLLT